MDLARHIYRRLNLLQHGLRFRVVASIVAAALCGGVFGSLLVTTYDLHGQRSALVDALTAQQLRTAQLAASGRSNPEIAEALFLTRRTVELHLTGAYRKLEIDSREQLAGALADGDD